MEPGRRAAAILIGALLVIHTTGAIGEAEPMSDLTISSPAFENGGIIPARHTCDGEDTNPPLRIGNVPREAKSLALIVDDPDAPRGTWVHWVAWNIDPGTREIGEGAVPQGTAQGVNDFRNRRYGGPCPPSGTHRYYFKLYALDTRLDLGPDSTKSQLESAMKGHVLAKAEFVGRYGRAKER